MRLFLVILSFGMFFVTSCKTKSTRDYKREAAVEFVKNQVDLMEALAVSNFNENNLTINDFLKIYMDDDSVSKPEFGYKVMHVGVSKDANFRNQGDFSLVFQQNSLIYCINRGFGKESDPQIEKISQSDLHNLINKNIKIEYK